MKIVLEHKQRNGRRMLQGSTFYIPAKCLSVQMHLLTFHITYPLLKCTFYYKVIQCLLKRFSAYQSAVDKYTIKLVCLLTDGEPAVLSR